MENIVKFKGGIIKNKKRSKDTTITIKVDSELRHEWNKFCINNDVNQRATLETIIKQIIRG